LNRKIKEVDAHLAAFRRLAHTLRGMLRVMVLLRSHLPLIDLRRFVFALACARPSQLFIRSDCKWRMVAGLWGPIVRVRVKRPQVAGELSLGRACPSFWRHGWPSSFNLGGVGGTGPPRDSLSDQLRAPQSFGLEPGTH
jgi:hypothetical protein